MKFKSISLAILFAGIHSASASFSLDFSGLDGATFSGSDGDEQVIMVDQFGNVDFGVDPPKESATISFFDVGDDGDASNDVEVINFDSNKTITVRFSSGSDVTGVTVAVVGFDPGVEAIYTPISNQEGTITVPSGSGGISGLTFERVGPKIPEPSTALLGGLGLLALLRRRR